MSGEVLIVDCMDVEATNVTTVHLMTESYFASNGAPLPYKLLKVMPASYRETRPSFWSINTNSWHEVF